MRAHQTDKYTNTDEAWCEQREKLWHNRREASEKSGAYYLHIILYDYNRPIVGRVEVGVGWILALELFIVAMLVCRERLAHLAIG